MAGLRPGEEEPQGQQQEQQHPALQAAAAARGKAGDTIQAELHLQPGWLGLRHLQPRRAQPCQPGLATRLPPRLQGSHGGQMQRELLGCGGAPPQPQWPEAQRLLAQQAVGLVAALRHLQWELVLAVGCLASHHPAQQPVAAARAG